MNPNTPDHAKVKDEPDLIRDLRSGAILSNSLAARKAFIEAQKKKIQIDKYEERITKLEGSVYRIEDMLKQLLNSGGVQQEKPQE